MSPFIHRFGGAALFVAIMIVVGVISRCGSIGDQSIIAEHTSEFKKTEISATTLTAVNQSGFIALHPGTNNIVHSGTEKTVGSAIFNEPVYWFNFGEKMKKGKDGKDKVVKDKDGNIVPKQKVACGASFGAKLYRMYEWMTSEYDGCEPYYIECYRSSWKQLSAVWVMTLGKAGGLPLQSSGGGHAIGRSADIHATCMDGRIPLGKLDNGTIVWYGTEPRKGAGLQGIKPDPATKADVLSWIKDVRFTDELAELSKRPDYNEAKCLEWAYKVVRGLISARLEGVHMVILEAAQDEGLTGGGCTKARALDGGHYTEIDSAIDIPADDKWTSCERGSEQWNSWYSRSLKKGGFNNPLLTVAQCTGR